MGLKDPRTYRQQESGCDQCVALGQQGRQRSMTLLLDGGQGMAGR
jgi:hypothetical protein